MFISVNLESPFALAAFLAANANLQKVYVPASFSMSRVLEGLESQQSSVVLIDNELFDLEVPAGKQAELKAQAARVKHALLAGK